MANSPARAANRNWNLPNLLTYGRVVAVPLVVAFLFWPADPWALTVEAFEGPVICVAEADEFSLRDWRRNALDGSNLVPQGGIGAFVARRLGTGLDIRLNTPVTRLRWNGPGGRVTVETPRGSLSARAAILTVSTGVLASGALAFEPAPGKDTI